MARRTTITVFEHHALRVGDQGFTEGQLLALQRFHAEKDFPYYSLIHNGVKFREYVGVLQVGNIVVEILPKADHDTDANTWRRVLIGMIRASGLLKISAPTSTTLAIRPNAILDLYVEQFVAELEYLLHRGLAKRYRKTQGNLTSVKGRIIFSKHLQQNHVHQERMYTEYTEFTRDHLLHQILYKALKLLPQLRADGLLKGRIQALLLTFPEMPEIKVSESTFSRVVLNRNTQHYASALEIARMLLLNHHPDIARGSNDVLALMFDMNMLWERFVYASLKKHMHTDMDVRAQQRKPYWKPENGARTTIRPDIVIMSGHVSFVLDTKWKNIDSSGISAADLHQMYVYHEYFDATKVALIYPSISEKSARGSYLSPTHASPINKECSLLPVGTSNINDTQVWQRQIVDYVMRWVEWEK
jgi:5-methylcytosine-specific restriction enzyme subunit McrC